jgi:hypothetical protein
MTSLRCCEMPQPQLPQLHLALGALALLPLLGAADYAQRGQPTAAAVLGALAPPPPPPPPPPEGACPQCCFEIIDDHGCPGSFDCNTCPMGAHGLVNVKADFGAIGNYGIDDTVAIQKAINFCKKTSRGLFFPPGAYAVTSPLDFGAWNGIHVEGGVPGANGIAGSGATVQINAQLNRTYGACFDFSGSAYGKVSGIAFGGTNCQVMALNARTCCENKQDQNRSSGSIYGSDITYERCNFAGGYVCDQRLPACTLRRSGCLPARFVRKGELCSH